MWFFSLDAGQRLAVRVARRLFHLPYFDANFEIAYRGDGVEYSAVRKQRGAPKATFAANYRPTGPVYHSAPGSLDSWLTERYCLYAADGAGHLYRSEIDHDRWPLQPAAAELQINTLGEWLGIEMKCPPATLCAPAATALSQTCSNSFEAAASNRPVTRTTITLFLLVDSI